jgi:hypothetical protein
MDVLPDRRPCNGTRVNMRAFMVTGLCTALAVATAQPARAQDSPAPAPSAEAAPPAAKKDDDTLGKVKKYLLSRPKDAPSRLERIIVSSGAGAVSVVGLGVGIGFGLWALYDYQCLRDVKACNNNRTGGDKITGTKFLQARQVGERKALVADMGYLMAVTFAGVAALGLASAFWPSGWWPFATEDVVETAPTQVVTDIAPTSQPAAATGGAK